MSQEADRLDGVAKKSLYKNVVNAETIKYSFEIFRRHLVDGSVLEMGPAEGIMTELLARDDRDVTVLEGSDIFCEQLRTQFPTVTVVNSLFEDFVPEKSFDNIILGHVLEHVNDPVAILSLVSSWLAPGGLMLCAVPNARSLHRQAGVIMDVLEQEDSLNEMDIHHGHRRVFNPESFRQVFKQSGLKIKLFGGYWLKPVSMKQIEDSWSQEMLHAFMVLGERYPDIAGEIYVIAAKE